MKKKLMAFGAFVLVVSLLASSINAWYDGKWDKRRQDWNNATLSASTSYGLVYALNGTHGVDTSATGLGLSNTCEELKITNSTDDGTLPWYVVNSSDPKYGCGQTTTDIRVRNDIPAGETKPNAYVYYSNETPVSDGSDQSGVYDDFVAAFPFSMYDGQQVFDKSSYARVGEMVGNASATTWTNGVIGRALYLNGSEYFWGSNVSQFNGLTEACGMVWYYANVSGEDYIFQVGSGLDDLRMIMYDGRVAVGAVDWAMSILSPAGTLRLNEWQFMAFTFDGSKGYLYMNDTLAGTDAAVTNTSIDTTGYWMIGNDWQFKTVGHQFTGAIDELMILRRNCTESEIFTYYQQGRASLSKLSDLQGEVSEFWEDEVVLDIPLDDGQSASLTVGFTYTPSFHSSQIDNCSLYTNETSWSLKHSNSTPVTNGSLNTIQETFSTWGDYEWNIECCNSTDCLYGRFNRSVIVQNRPPIAYDENPTHGWDFEQDGSDWIGSIDMVNASGVVYNSTVRKQGTYSWELSMLANEYYTHPTFLDDLNTTYGQTGFAFEAWLYAKSKANPPGNDTGTFVLLDKWQNAPGTNFFTVGAFDDSIPNNWEWETFTAGRKCDSETCTYQGGYFNSSYVNTGQWYHLLVSMDPLGGMFIFLNGSLDAYNTSYQYGIPANGTHTDFRFGTNWINSERGDGFVDAVAFYDHNVTEGEARRAYMRINNYSMGATYQFNVTINEPDGVADIKNVYFEFNTTSPINSTLVNSTNITTYRNINSTANEYYITTTDDLTAGDYSWRFYVEDSIGQEASTSQGRFSVTSDVTPSFLTATFNYASVAFGSGLSAGSANNSAPNQTAGSYNVSISASGNYKCEALGGNWTDGSGHGFHISKLIMDLNTTAGNLAVGDGVALSEANQTINTGIPSAQTLNYHGYWLSIPSTQYAGTYSSNVTVTYSLA